MEEGFHPAVIIPDRPSPKAPQNRNISTVMSFPRNFPDMFITIFGLMSGHFYFWERRHSSPRERRLTLAQR
jgi:hypothetical protein